MTEPYGNPVPSASPYAEPEDAPPAAFIAGQYPPQGYFSHQYAQTPGFPVPSDAPPHLGPAGYPAAINPNDKTNGMAITALIFGLSGFLFLPACIGLGLGFGALGTIKRTGQPGKGLAIAGIALSSAWVGLWLLLIILS